MVNFFLSPMQYFPLLAGCGLSHSRSAYFNPPPHVLLQLLIGPHFPQPPWTAAGRAPMSTHSLCMHHWEQTLFAFFLPSLFLFLFVKFFGNFFWREYNGGKICNLFPLVSINKQGLIQVSLCDLWKEKRRFSTNFTNHIR